MFVEKSSLKKEKKLIKGFAACWIFVDYYFWITHLNSVNSVNMQLFIVVSYCELFTYSSTSKINR